MTITKIYKTKNRQTKETKYYKNGKLKAILSITRPCKGK